ncbi:ABC transporter ATP-binding protein [Paenibacillus oralis]|uniref:ABC transporter ATP-binding protein n=1 Tax=Paenibacillus oralis TaxID=2490856 RepID=A0A3P3U3H4_9BACL|nr:ABC transporter ATP-binding protein [Paenibacillus oralis]RRJ64098.1 ABC transporter ATP-binding protein [Paenibacillus oralis]
MTDKLLLRVSNLEKSFSNQPILRNISFEIHKGEVLGLVGPNGSGKTTTIRTILDFYKPNSGSITLLHTDCNKHFDQVGRRIGVMLESSGMYPLLTGREYLEFFGQIGAMAGKELAAAVDDALDKTGLIDAQNKRIGTYSKGMIQRLAFGRAILNRPALLILDEPFDGIDVEAKRNLMDVIASMRHEGLGVLITSHNLKEVDEICTRMIFIKNGRIVHDNTLNEIRDMYREDAVFHIFFHPDVDGAKVQALFPGDPYDDVKKVLHARLTAHHTKEKIMDIIFENKLQVREAYEENKNIEDIYMDFMKSN